MMNHIHRLLLIAAAFAASGCVSLLPETAPPKPRYNITTPDTAALEGDLLNWSLVIDDPRTTRAYDSVRVAVTPAPGKIEYFAGAEWADRAPRLFQTALVQTFEDAGRIIAVGDRGAVPVGDVILQTDIRRMHYDVRNRSGQADVAIYARLGDGKGGVYAVRRFMASTPANGDNADAVIAAFNASFESLIPEIVAWTYEQGEAALSARTN
ncbi:MAG: ABC-type transport auxiliary lipoprotein family protein [Pseudomonadota bacterium]